MSDPIPVETPGGFAPAYAIGHDDGSGHLALVTPDHPLPTFAARPATPAALYGATSQTLLAGPFTPTPFAPVYLALSGEWQGSVRLLRSTDSGVTRLPVTIAGAEWGHYSANACEPVWQESEAGAQLWLELAPISGSITYRVSQ